MNSLKFQGYELKKNTSKRKYASNGKDFLRLPFEIYYAGPLTYSSLELLSKTGNLKNPKDIKGVRLEQGFGSGTTFYCGNNYGAELFCCLTNGHDETTPPWLKFLKEDDMEIKYGATYEVSIDAKGIDLVAKKAGEDLLGDLDPTGISYGMYHLANETPDYIILDAGGDRIKINLDGYVLGDSGEVDENQRIFIVEALEDDDSLFDFKTSEFWDIQDAWIKDVWETYFPELTPLKIKKYVPL
jgi:hypothetical protein